MRSLLFAALATLAALTSSCAFDNQDRRILLNYLDANWTPSSTAGKWIASPITLPVGMAAGVTDAVLIHPVLQVDDAWRDTIDVLWHFDESTRFRTVLLTPLSALATPVVFGLSWCTRSVFDIDDHEPDDDDPPEPAAPQPSAGDDAKEETR